MTTYDPALYALVHRGTPGDEVFYARLCAGQRVLELGAGFGRLLPTLAGAASRYLGIEQDAGMLALARVAHDALPKAMRTRAELMHADMRDFSLSERFDRILIPHSGLWCLEGDTDVARCLERVAEHLAPGGELVLDAYHADPFHEQSLPGDMADDHEEHVARVQHEGVELDVFERSNWDRDAQRMEVVYRYAPSAGSGSGPDLDLEGTIVHRYLLCDQLATALVHAGFTELAFQCDFEGTPIDDEHELLVVRARLE